MSGDPPREPGPAAHGMSPGEALDAIERLCAGEPCPGPLRAHLGVRHVAIEPSLAGREVDLVRGLDLGARLAVVSDDDTHRAMGARLESALGGAFSIEPVALGRRPEATAELCAEIERAVAPRCDAIIAVGAGTVNDLCKMAAARLGRPYAVFGTAPSMNGYASVSASLTVDGIKRSLPAVAPAGVFLDLDVLCAAPVRLIRGGLGECLCRPTAQVDWLMSHLLLGTAYSEVPFAILSADEPALLAEPAALIAGDVAAMRHMARTLVLSGLGMTLCGGSYPASQGEHLLSHYMHMFHPTADEPLHGEQMAITVQVMASLQERILALAEPPRISASSHQRDQLEARYGRERAQHCWSALESKRLTAERAEALSAMLARDWDALRARLAAIARPVDQLRAVLQAAGAPVAPADIGWSRDALEDACRHAHEIRDRFTFLDLAVHLDADIRPEAP